MIRYLSIQEFGERRGLTIATMRAYQREGRLPEADAQIGDEPARYGWLPETIDNWKRPGQGARTDLRKASKTP